MTTINLNPSITVGAGPIPTDSAALLQNPLANITLGALGAVDGTGQVRRLQSDSQGRLMVSDWDLINQLIVEVRALQSIVAVGLNVNEEIDSFRSDLSIDPSQDLPNP